MPPMEFEPTIPARARPQTYAVDRAPTGTGMRKITCLYYAYLTQSGRDRQLLCPLLTL
jgi:hypothetical protein